ncbi:MAG: general secretion pathway protein GspL [Deltaproteobacteria bacterium]|nr:general secretion pathway protein GspL [Deltaproteobacteria bacterium]TLN03418.1 MAG: general secretion pathway protein GspL [bacterium]
MELLIIEAGRRSVGLVRFLKKGGAVFFQGDKRKSLDDDTSLSALLQDLAVEEAGGCKVFLSLDAEQIFFRELHLPISDRRKQREVLPLELKGETAIDVEKLIFDALPLGGGKVMAIWAVEADLTEKIASLREAGLEPQVVGSSLFHWQQLIPESVGDAAVALSDGFSLAVYCQRKPLLFRSLVDGNFLEEIARTLVLLEAGKGVQVERVLLHGSAATSAQDSQTGRIVFTQLPVSGALAEAFPCDSMAVENAGAWALATESLRGEPINFRQGKIAYTAGRDRLKKKLRLTAILAAVFLVLLLVETGLRYYFVRTDLSSLDASIHQIYREVFPNRTKAVDEVAEVKSEIRNLGGATASQEILQALNGVAKAKTDDILAIYEAEVDSGQILLKGDARSFNAANNFKSRLDPLFAAAKMDEVKSRPDGSVTFTFRGTLQEGEK